MKNVAIALVLAAALLPVLGSAQQLPGLEETSAGQAGAPSFVAPLSFREAVEIRGGTEKEEASIEIGRNKGRTNWNTTFTTPVDKEKKEGVLATLDGLADSIRLEGEVSRFLFNTQRRPVDIGAQDEACIRAGALRGYDQKAVEEKFISGKDGTCDDLTSPGSALEDSFYNGDYSDAQKAQIAAQLRPIRSAYIKATIKRPWISQLRGGLTVGTEDFKFLSAASLEAEKDDKTEWAAHFGMTWVNVADRLSLGFEYRREETYEDSGKGTVCAPSNTVPGVLDCKTSPIGPPVNKHKDLLAATFNLIRGKWAMSSIVTRDFEENESGVEVPFYLVRNKDRAWTGGVSLGWTTKEHDLTAQVFIGVPFKIF